MINTIEIPVVMNLSSFLNSSDLTGEENHNQLSDLENGDGEDKTSGSTSCTVFTEEDIVAKTTKEPKNSLNLAKQCISERSSDDSVGNSVLSSSSAVLTNGDGSRRFSLAFAKRPGKTLSWSGVNMEVKKTRSKASKVVLDNVWGSVPEKEVTAIMGPSGSGKTSLLNILSGRMKNNSKVSVSCDVRLNKYEVIPHKMEVRKQIAYVPQEDSIQATSTPREAIYFSAKLRLPRHTSEDHLKTLTNEMITELGLSSCADTIIGGNLEKGISGGERKRTSVGVELVVRPALVFLDEPTSGLDSFSAVQLVQVLYKVADAGSSVLFTIHQPNSDLFNSFNRLLFLNQGRIMYEGSVKDLPEYFSQHGHELPLHYNPADWIMHVAQTIPIRDLDNLGFFPNNTKRPQRSRRPSGGKDALGNKVSAKHNNAKHVSYFTEVKLLLYREFLEIKRNSNIVKARLSITIFMSLLIGSVFYGSGSRTLDDTESLNASFGALLMILIQSIFSTALPSLLAFPEHRPIFVREYSTNHYSVAAYFTSRLTVEAFLTACQMVLLCIFTYYFVGFQMGFFRLFILMFSLAMSSTAIAIMIGSIIDEVRMAQQFLQIVLIPQVLLCGYFIPSYYVPVWLRWAEWICSLTYGVQIAMIYEYEQNCQTDMCKVLIESRHLSSSQIWWNWLALFLLFAFFRLTALFFLQKKAKKFY